ncbi:MAG: LLM class flavin-dependent oxidoreductase, partial [Acidimicrobiales bacterium]
MKLDAMAMGLPLREAQRLAADIEEAGFSGLWFTEGGRTAYLGATAAALATSELDLGTGIAVAFPRSPMITASVAWELAEATGGRFVLGLGTQVKAHIERRYGVTYEHPGPWLREYVLALRAIFRAFQGEERLDFHGEHYDLDLLPPTSRRPGS